MTCWWSVVFVFYWGGGEVITQKILDATLRLLIFKANCQLWSISVSCCDCCEPDIYIMSNKTLHCSRVASDHYIETYFKLTLSHLNYAWKTMLDNLFRNKWSLRLLSLWKQRILPRNQTHIRKLKIAKIWKFFLHQYIFTMSRPRVHSIS